MRIHAAHFVDVLVYLVVLGMFIQFFPSVISETFTLALLTAILLKVVLELVLKLKKLVLGRIKASMTTASRVVNVTVLVLLLPGSKFVVIELIALFFGDSVQLGGFWQVAALIIVLMLARAGVRRLLPSPERAASDSTE